MDPLAQHQEFTVKISQLIQQLQDIQSQMGDLEVFADDFRDQGESEETPCTLFWTVAEFGNRLIFSSVDWTKYHSLSEQQKLRSSGPDVPRRMR